MTISIMNKRDTKNLLFFDINPNKIFNKFYHTGSFLARSALSWFGFCPISVNVKSGYFTVRQIDI